MQEICWNTEVFPNEIFRYCVTKSFRRRNLIPPLWCTKYTTRKFLIHRSVPPTKLFGTVWQLFFDGKSWYSPLPLLSKNFFATGHFLKHTSEGFLYESFRSCETKNFEKTVIPSLLCMRIFDTRILSKHRRVLLRNLSALWDKDFSKEFSDIPFLCIKFCHARKFLKHRSVP